MGTDDHIRSFGMSGMMLTEELRAIEPRLHDVWTAFRHHHVEPGPLRRHLQQLTAVEKVMASLNLLRGPIGHCCRLSEDEVDRLAVKDCSG